MTQQSYDWDLFISYSNTDRTAVAQKLVEKLEQAGLRVWIDWMALNPGDNLRRGVNHAISRSRFGVVILSPSFLEKKWTTDELGAMMALETADQDIVIPVLHDISSAVFAKAYPLLANRVRLNTADGLDHVAAALIRTVFRKGADTPSAQFPGVRTRFLNLLNDGRSKRDDVREFLRHHDGIAKRAVGATCEPAIAWLPQFPECTPDFCVTNYLPTSGMRDAYVVFLGPVSSRLFTEAGQPVDSVEQAVASLERLRAWIMSNYEVAYQVVPGINARFQGFVVEGRRDELSGAQREQLKEFNDLLFGIHLRSYDWLVDASE